MAAPAIVAAAPKPPALKKVTIKRTPAIAARHGGIPAVAAPAIAAAPKPPVRHIAPVRKIPAPRSTLFCAVQFEGITIFTSGSENNKTEPRIAATRRAYERTLKELAGPPGLQAVRLK